MLLPGDVIRQTLARLCAVEVLQVPVASEMQADDRRRLALAFQSVSPVPMQLSPIAGESMMVKQKKTVRFRMPEAEFDPPSDAAKDPFRPGRMASQLPIQGSAARF